ncbi:MAG: hypothetical protein WHV61_00695 [Burkholderiales bacterium]
MKLEYNYRIGPAGIEFSLVEDLDDGIEVQGTPEQRMTVQRYVMLAWQEAINHTFTPEQIRELMATPEGQRQLQEGAEGYLAKLLENFPPELDRRKTPDRRDWSKRPRDGSTDRRRSRRTAGA